MNSRSSGGLVSSVAPGSIAEEGGIEAGDWVVALDGHRLRDVIDYRFWSSAEELTLVYRRGDEEHEVLIEKEWDEDLGIEFETPLFDGIKSCRNNCTFCFLKNLPRGLRRSLYIKDDDYRLSFLFGNFITLSNVTDADLARIEEQRLSPLFVSVHATDRDLRNRLMGVDAPDVLEQIDDLGRRRIAMNAQVVLCPGLNDGPPLERTIEDLAARHEVVMSVAVVPVGLTRYCRDPRLRSYTAGEARQIVKRVTAVQRRLRGRLGKTFVHLADEFYTLTGTPVPPAGWYDGFPQLDNGVGLVRRLLSSWANCRRRLPVAVPRPRRVGWICGTSACPTLQHIAEDVNRVDGIHVEVHPVVNEFFGATVTVSGLLAGVDVLATLKERRLDEWVLPRVMFDSSGERTLDGMTLQQLMVEAPDPVSVAASCRELLNASLLGSAPCAA